MATLGATLTPRLRNFDFAPIAQIELNTSIILSQFGVLVGIQHVNAGIYRSVMMGYIEGTAGLVERSAHWNGHTLRYLQTTPMHSNVYLARFWAVDIDFRRSLISDDRRSLTVVPSLHFGWTFAPF